MSKAITDSLQVVSFSLKNQSNEKEENYAIPIEFVREIRNLEEITEIPNAKSFVKGIMNLRGIIIPILDIKTKLGIGNTIPKKSKQQILVAEFEKNLFGLLIDKIDQVLILSQKNIDDAPSDAFDSTNYIQGIAKTASKLIIILDLISLLDQHQNKKFSSKNPRENLLLDSSKKPSISQNEDNKTKKFKSIQDEDIPEELKEILDEDSSKNTKFTTEAPKSDDINSLNNNEQDNYQNKVEMETKRIQSENL